MSDKFSGRTGILLIAHGSRRQRANDDLHALADLVRARLDDEIVKLGYLELAEPTIPAGARMCVEAGAQSVLLVPYFLSEGEHVIRDLEQYRRDLSEEHPGIEFRLCPPLGLHPQIVDVVLDRIEAGRSEIRSRSDAGPMRNSN